MSGENVVKQGLSKGQLFFGLFFAGAGVVFLLMAFFGNYTLSFHKILLPQWVFYIVAVIALLFGVYGMRQAIRAWKCVFCGSVLSYGEAYFQPEYEDRLRSIVHSATPEELKGVPPYGKGDSWICLTLDYCDKCGRVGIVTLTRGSRGGEKARLDKPAILPAGKAALFAPYVVPSARIDPLELDD